MTKDPNLGYVPKFRLPKAYEVRERLLTKYSGSRSPLVWTERGPYKDIVGSSNGNTRPGVGAITSGRVRAYSYENTKYLDLDGSLDTEDPYFAGGFTIKNGYMYPNELHGLGIKHL